MNDQPPPQPSSGDLWATVISDMNERRSVGIERYGTPLQPFNGRKPLVDAYQELLDLVVYLRQELAERELLTQQLSECHDYMQGLCGPTGPIDGSAEEARCLLRKHGQLK